MHDDELDRVLSEEGLVPSSGFTARVMEAVRQEAAEPSPIAFPWKRALPAFLTWIAALAALFAGAGAGQSAAQEPVVSKLITGATAALSSANRYGLGWIGLALAVPAVSVALSFWLTQRRVRG